jgi:hypothetical protein
MEPTPNVRLNSPNSDAGEAIKCDNDRAENSIENIEDLSAGKDLPDGNEAGRHAQGEDTGKTGVHDDNESTSNKKEAPSPAKSSQEDNKNPNKDDINRMGAASSAQSVLASPDRREDAVHADDDGGPLAGGQKERVLHNDDEASERDDAIVEDLLCDLSTVMRSDSDVSFGGTWTVVLQVSLYACGCVFVCVYICTHTHMDF